MFREGIPILSYGWLSSQAYEREGRRLAGVEMKGYYGG